MMSSRLWMVFVCLILLVGYYCGRLDGGSKAKREAQEELGAIAHALDPTWGFAVQELVEVYPTEGRTWVPLRHKVVKIGDKTLDVVIGKVRIDYSEPISYGQTSIPHTVTVLPDSTPTARFTTIPW